MLHELSSVHPIYKLMVLDQIVVYVKPYITSIPINLWGRDFLEQTKATVSLNEPF